MSYAMPRVEAPNILAALARGSQYRAAQREEEEGNALRDLLPSLAAGLSSQNPQVYGNALSGLAASGAQGLQVALPLIRQQREQSMIAGIMGGGGGGGMDAGMGMPLAPAPPMQPGAMPGAMPAAASVPAPAGGGVPSQGGPPAAPQSGDNPFRRGSDPDTLRANAQLHRDIVLQINQSEQPQDVRERLIQGVSQLRVQAQTGQGPGTQYRNDAWWGRDLPQPQRPQDATGGVAGVAAAGGTPPAGGDQRDPEAMRRQGRALLAMGSPGAQALGQSIMSEAAALESRRATDQGRRDALTARREDAAQRRGESDLDYERRLRDRREDQGERERIRADERRERDEERRRRDDERRANASPFGNGAQGQAGNILLELGPKIEDGSASPREVQTFRQGVALWQRESIDPATQQRLPGMPLSPETQRALTALDRRERDATGVPPPSRSPTASPPRVETDAAGNSRVVQAPQITPQAREDVRRAEVEADRFYAAVQGLREAVRESGANGALGAFFNNPRDPRAQRLNAAYSNLEIVMRGETLMNTGVLQPAEMQMLRDRLLSPQSFRGLMASPDARDAQLGELEGLVRRGVASRRRAAGLDDDGPRGGDAGTPGPGGVGIAEPPARGGRLRFNPATGKVE